MRWKAKVFAVPCSTVLIETRRVHLHLRTSPFASAPMARVIFRFGRQLPALGLSNFAQWHCPCMQRTAVMFIASLLSKAGRLVQEVSLTRSVWLKSCLGTLRVRPLSSLEQGDPSLLTSQVLYTFAYGLGLVAPDIVGFTIRRDPCPEVS